MIDSHTHVHGPEYDGDRKDVFARAAEAGVAEMIAIGCDVETSEKAVALAEANESIWATVGFHPHDAKTASPETMARMRELARSPKVIAWGEAGLDFFYLHSPRETQIAVFREQIQNALEDDRPIVIHTRDAWEETFEILSDHPGLRGVFHCFTGTRTEMEKAIAMGFYLSLSGIVTFKKADELKAVAREVPLDRLLIETDCPYLTPIPHRGKRNEPSYVRFVLEEIAKVRGVETAAIDLATTENTRRLFKIPDAGST